MEKQDAAIKLAFYNGNTMAEETELQYDIDRKTPNLVKPRNEALVHTSKYLLEAYATEGWLENCGPYWKTDHIEAALLSDPQTLANSSASMAARHKETTETIKNGYAKVV